MLLWNFHKLYELSVHLQTYSDALFQFSSDLLAQLWYFILFKDKFNECHYYFWKLSESHNIQLFCAEKWSNGIFNHFWNVEHNKKGSTIGEQIVRYIINNNRQPIYT